MMDPTANLAEQLEIAREMQDLGDVDLPVSQDDAQRLAELVIALDEWVRSGGFLPAAWQRD
jgi:hypothetical protein